MKNIPDLVNRICQPNPAVYKEELERDLLYKRNKHIFYIIIASLAILFAFYVITNTQIKTLQLVWTSLTILNLIIFCICCRSYIFVHEIFFCALVGISGPALHYFIPDSVFYNMVFVYVGPLWGLYLGGNKSYVFLSALQLIYLNFLYRDRLLQILSFGDLEYCVKRMANLSSLGVFVITFLVFSVQSTLVRAHQQIAEDKVKKADLERQKIFFLSFSHEIRNLINAITGSMQLVMMEDLSDKIRSYLQNAEVCGEMLLHLVNNILDTGKIEVGELEINPSNVRINDTLEKAWCICSQLIKTKRLTGKMTVGKDLPTMINIDNYRLMQIMLNLVSNSTKFTEKGSINIDVDFIRDKENVDKGCFEPEPFNEDEGLFEKNQAMKCLSESTDKLNLQKKQITRKDSASYIESSTNNGILKITVTDTGPGIEVDNLSRLFKKFSQVSSDPSKRKLGTGLGLFITRQIVEKMNGEIRAFSKPKRGTVLIVCIPVKPVATTCHNVLPMNSLQELIEASNLNAMVVDDDEFNLAVLSNTLNKLKVKVRTLARNGQEAVTKYKASVSGNKSFDVVTLDVDMPVMDGKKAMRLIREFEKENNLKPCLLIMVSGNCSESEIAECVGNGEKSHPDKADLFFKKPTKVDDFAKALKKRLQNNRESEGTLLINNIEC